MPDQPKEFTEKDLATKGLDFDFSETNWGFSGKNYLFVIGIDKYQHWTPLKCAVKDVRDFVKIVTERYQFDDSQVFMLLDEEGTQKNILKIFRELAQIVTTQDNLVIYFSGHGHYDEVSKTGYWIPVDSETGHENEYQFINTAIIVDRLKGIDSLHTLLIIDACFSGTLITQIRSSPRSERYKSRRVFTSGRAEVVRDGPEGGNSPFAKGILNNLSLNTSKHFPASKLILDVIEYVEKEAQQTPTDARLVNADDQGGDFVFHLKISEAELWANVVSQNTKEAYQKFMEQFPQSGHFAEALEAFDWLKAFQINTINSLHQFLSKYQPSGKYIPLAIKTLDELEEEKCWKQAAEKNTLSAYFDYLYRYPDGKYVAEAKEKTRQMPGDEDDKAIQRAIEVNETEAYQEYLNKPGTKKHQEMAEKKLSSLSAHPIKHTEEEFSWDKAQSTATYIGLLNFIQVYPQSKYLEDARREMKRLDDIALNQVRLAEHNSNISLHEKIKKCIDYFNDFPGAGNNPKVKQIKDRLEIKKFSLGS
ncbi:hypothetical protein BH23BAC1_BH23BAC1_17880 [soil metagenome]